MDWADDIAALLVMLMPGQEEGNAAADILFGEANPSARLPLTFPSRCTHACPPILLDVSPFPPGCLAVFSGFLASRRRHPDTCFGRRNEVNMSKQMYPGVIDPADGVLKGQYSEQLKVRPYTAFRLTNLNS